MVKIRAYGSKAFAVINLHGVSTKKLSLYVLSPYKRTKNLVSEVFCLVHIQWPGQTNCLLCTLIVVISLHQLCF